MKYINYLLAILSLCFSTLVFANQPVDPDHCPSPSALQQSKFIIALPAKIMPAWVAFQKESKYDTNSTWLFGVISQGAGPLQAIKNAYSVVSTLGQPQGPFSVLGVWFCNYPTADGNGAQARVMNN